MFNLFKKTPDDSLQDCVRRTVNYLLTALPTPTTVDDQDLPCRVTAADIPSLLRVSENPSTAGLTFPPGVSPLSSSDLWRSATSLLISRISPFPPDAIERAGAASTDREKVVLAIACLYACLCGNVPASAVGPTLAACTQGLDLEDLIAVMGAATGTGVSPAAFDVLTASLPRHEERLCDDVPNRIELAEMLIDASSVHADRYAQWVCDDIEDDWIENLEPKAKGDIDYRFGLMLLRCIERCLSHPAGDPIRLTGMKQAIIARYPNDLMPPL